MKQKMSVAVPLMQFVIAAGIALCIGAALYSHEYTAFQLWLQGITVVLALINTVLTWKQYRADRNDDDAGDGGGEQE